MDFKDIDITQKLIKLEEHGEDVVVWNFKELWTTVRVTKNESLFKYYDEWEKEREEITKKLFQIIPTKHHKEVKERLKNAKEKLIKKESEFLGFGKERFPLFYVEGELFVKEVDIDKVLSFVFKEERIKEKEKIADIKMIISAMRKILDDYENGKL